ncbi:MAG: rod shape-determining protein MreD [Bacteroidetes bacterium]|nr:rod shape-determining protein MreD [Bacteroidota bacterium]
MNYLWYAIAGLILLLVQLNLGYIAVESITPDLLVILTVFIAIREGQFAGEIAGFVLGLFFDIISSDIIGTNALSKMLAGFVAGYFFTEGAALSESVGKFKFLGVMGLAALVHNIVYYFFYVQPTNLSFISFFVSHGIAASLYTTVVSVIVMLVAARKQRW